MYGIQGALIRTVSVRNVGIGCCNSRYMGTMLARGIVVMCDIIIHVHVVVCKWVLAVEIQLLRSDILNI